MEMFILNGDYFKIGEIAKQDIYQFIKNTGESLGDYHFSSYLDYYLKRYNIRVLEHHFSSRKIEGLTLIDKEGISFSYEKENSTEKQNFTMCHELGHFVLGHSGKCFTELRGKSDSVKEREANIFSATVLMPDIVLLAKIFYRKDSFQKVKEELAVSCEALFYRLVDIFQSLLPKDEIEIFQVVCEYYQGYNQKIINCFFKIKENIITEYKKVGYDIFKRLIYELEINGFIASNNFPELLSNKFRKQFGAKYSNVKTWVEFEFGKTVAYAWLSDKMTKKQAKIKARTILLLK